MRAISGIPLKDQQYLLVGVSCGLQDGFPEQPKLNYDHGLEDKSMAIYVGKGLVKGNKAFFLDVMQSGWRQYVNKCDQPLINTSNVCPSSCAEHANENLIYYLVDSRQVTAVLNNSKPRFLSMIAPPDTGQIILTAEETTTLAAKSLFAQLIEQQGKTNKNAVTLKFVTAVWFQYKTSHVPSPVLYLKADGTQVAHFPESPAKWASVDDQSQTAAMLDSSNCLDETCPPVEAEVAQQAYWDGI